MNVKASVALAVLVVSTVGLSACASSATVPGAAVPPAGSVTSSSASVSPSTSTPSPSASPSASRSVSATPPSDTDSSSLPSDTDSSTPPSTADSSSPTAAPPSGSETGKCWYGACYSYVTGRQYTDTTGASVNMEQASPANVAADGHSLQELSLQNSDDTTTANTIEIGWTVDPGANGDYQPHLFVYHWINGHQTCYNGCGFVQVSTSVTAGMALAPGRTGTFGLRFNQGNWWAYYNDVAFGYFPESAWSGAFTSAQVISAFGEVSADKEPSCTQMGNGVFGSKNGASSISGYKLFGATDQPDFQVSATDPNSYNYGSVTGTSFSLGGPGAC